MVTITFKKSLNINIPGMISGNQCPSRKTEPGDPKKQFFDPASAASPGFLFGP
jgi:hypothetical protein